jgi:CHAT domain-containing protein/tetratricopeptide (TPR) repeat protein
MSVAVVLTALAVQIPSAQTAKPAGPTEKNEKNEKNDKNAIEIAHPLEPGRAIERQLATGQSHTYRLTLRSGDYLHVTIVQQGIDVAATVIRPDGRELLSVDACDDDFREETLIVIADTDGPHTIIIRPAPSTTPSGQYTIRVDDVRPADAIDRVRLEAERAFEHGRVLLVSRVPATWPDALNAFESALGKYRQVGDRRGEMKTLIELAAVQQNLVRPEALSSAQEAEQIARDLQDRPATAAAMYFNGRAYERAGDLASALRAYEASTAISRAIGNRKAESTSLNTEGIVHGRNGDAEGAVNRFEQALPLARATNNRLVVSFLLNNLGLAYKDLGEQDKALAVFEQTLADRRAANDRASQAMLLLNIADVQRVFRRNEKALDAVLQALALSREIGHREYEAKALNGVGITYYEMRDYTKALEYHRTSLTVQGQLGDRSVQAVSLEGIGRALRRKGDPEQAVAPLRQALAIRQQIGEHYLEADTLRNLADVERDRGDLAGALHYIQSSVDLEERLRARMTSPELRATFVAAEWGKYEVFIDVLEQQRLADPNGGHEAAALQVSERARARVLLESLLDAHVDLRQGIDPALLERERGLQKQLNDASGQLSRALAAKTRSDQGDAAAQKVDQLARDYQVLQADIRRQSPHYAAMTQPQPLSATEIQQSVIDEDTVLLEFALGEQRSWLWAVTPRTIASFELPSRSAIEAASRSLYERFIARERHRGEQPGEYAGRVATADARLRTEAAAMSRMLLAGIAAPLSNEWRGKRLAIVATGALEYLPFAALPVPVPDADGSAARVRTNPARRRPAAALIAQHEIVTIPSASVVAVLRRETASRRPAARTIAILADPVFEKTDPRVVATTLAAAVGPGSETAWPSRITARSSLARLPFSRDEANAIASLVAPEQVFKATDFKASRAAALAGALTGYRLVHFATHGVLDSERPSLSGLILSLVDEHGAPRDGYLRLQDIYNLRLDADLVVLSACQTALGKAIKGEGLVGLARAFMYAGAPRVVASLWQVSDLATAELMKKFYRGMLHDRLPPAAALRAAQLEMSSDPRWASPYYWAGFVLQGDWK